MPLTPAEVRAVQFSTTRLRAGYDMDEVDAFLDIIEADIAQLADGLHRARDGEAVLRTQCDQLLQRVAVAERRVAELEAAVPVPTAEPAVTEELQVALAEHSDAAAVLAAAQAAGERIVGEAQQRADAIRASISRMLDAQRALLDPK